MIPPLNSVLAQDTVQIGPFEAMWKIHYIGQHPDTHLPELSCTVYFLADETSLLPSGLDYPGKFMDEELKGNWGVGQRHDGRNWREKCVSTHTDNVLQCIDNFKQEVETKLAKLRIHIRLVMDREQERKKVLEKAFEGFHMPQTVHPDEACFGLKPAEFDELEKLSFKNQER